MSGCTASTCSFGFTGPKDTSWSTLSYPSQWATQDDDCKEAVSAITITSSCIEESVESFVSRVILFGTIPINIPTIVPTTVPPIVHDDITVIHTKTPIILPVAPEAETAIVTSPAGVLDFIIHSSTDSDLLEDISPSEHVPTLPNTFPFLCTNPSETSSPTHDLSPAVVASPVPCRVVPRRPALLVLPGQKIPLGRPYRTHPNGLLRMMTARKRFQPLPLRLLASRYSSNHSSSDHFSSDHSSSDSSSDHPSSYFSFSPEDTSSDTPVAIFT
nr:hypothetical protein [Tanacetum cinerariifolium]